MNSTKLFLILFLFPFLATAQYCIPTGIVDKGGINNFQINSLVNYGSGYNSVYSFYPPGQFTTYLTIGQDYTVQITSTDSFMDYFKIWIDLNNDFIFSEDEQILDDNDRSPSASVYVTIPFDTSYVGIRRLRVMVGGHWDPFSSCDWSGYSGEAEDYVVHITDSIVPSTFCIPITDDSPSGFPIENSKLNTLHNCNSGYPEDGYTLFPDSLFTTQMEVGGTYPIYMSKAPAGLSGCFAAFIDYNNDSIFSNSEKEFQECWTHGASGTITIPNDSSVIGVHRLRLRSQWTSGSYFGPCHFVFDGETEDYWITIIQALPDTDTIVPPLPNRWEIAFDLPDKQWGQQILETYDKGFLIMGVTGQTYTPYQLKISIDGDTLWSKTYNTEYSVYQSVNNQSAIATQILSGINFYFKQKLSLDANLTSAISYLTSEVTDNIFDHADSSRSYFLTHIHNDVQILDIVIADCGITIAGSYKKIGKLYSSVDAIRKALEGHSTKYLDNARGFGIRTSRNMLVDGMSGKFCLFSGNAMYIKSKNQEGIIRLDCKGIMGTLVYMRVPFDYKEGFSYLKYI